MTRHKKILFICGSHNQTTMMHEISKHISGYDCYFTPYYCDGFLKLLYHARLLNFTMLGQHFQEKAIEYILRNDLKLDFEGRDNDYDLVVTSSDLIIQKNIKGKRIVHVQEGMTDPENFMYKLVKWLKLPRYLASTAATGLSNSYDTFCVASPGYKDHFVNKGISVDKIAVTGIPNFDNAARYLTNSFPYKNYVLAATSDARETFKYENRKKFIEKCKIIADGRPLIFKLHPNENFKRAKKEIEKYAPDALIYTSGNSDHMVANCDILVTKYSSVVYIGLALGKKVYSDFNLNELKQKVPIQNGGVSGRNIAHVCEKVLLNEKFSNEELSKKFSNYKLFQPAEALMVT